MVRPVKRSCASATVPQAKAWHALDAALPHVAGDYMGEHWLTSFAVLALLAPKQI